MGSQVGFGQLTPFLATMSNGYRSSFERLSPGGDNSPGHEYKNYIIRAQNYHKAWLARRPNRTAIANRTDMMAARRQEDERRRQQIPSGNGQGNQGQRRFEVTRRAQARMQQANVQQQQQKGPGGQQGPGTEGLGLTGMRIGSSSSSSQTTRCGKAARFRCLAEGGWAPGTRVSSSSSSLITIPKGKAAEVIRALVGGGWALGAHVSSLCPIGSDPMSGLPGHDATEAPTWSVWRRGQ